MAMLEGEPHKSCRTLLMPHFTRSSVEATASMIEETTKTHAERWHQRGDLRLVTALNALTFEIATRFLVGELANDERESLSRDFDVWTDGLFALPVNLPGTGFRNALAAKTRLIAQIQRIVERKTVERSTGGAQFDVLTSLLAARDEKGQALDTATIVDELHLMFFAGHDTTVTATTNALVHLLQQPDVLAQARAEQDLLGAGPMNRERIGRTEWLTQTLNESMRVIPPIASAFRVTTEPTTCGAFSIPAGWTIVLSPGGSHLHEAEFSQPAQFDPTRFDKANADKPSPMSFIPFGGGPRVCIGQHFAMLEMQIMLSLFVRDWQWSLKAPARLRWQALPSPRPKDGGHVLWQRRSSGSFGTSKAR